MTLKEPTTSTERGRKSRKDIVWSRLKLKSDIEEGLSYHRGNVCLNTLEKTTIAIEMKNPTQATEEVCFEPSSSDGGADQVSFYQSACPYHQSQIFGQEDTEN